MANIHEFSKRVIDLAERLEDMADAAEGRGARSERRGTRWLVLPTVGAGVYALVTNKALSRRAKGVVDQAKKRTSELPEDLLNRARAATQKQPHRTTARSRQNRSRRNSTRKTSSARSSSPSR
jgi:hypothetical protein